MRFIVSLYSHSGFAVWEFCYYRWPKYAIALRSMSLLGSIMKNTTQYLLLTLVVSFFVSCCHQSETNPVAYDQTGVVFVKGVPDRPQHDSTSPFNSLASYGKSDRFEVATWNIENFPKADRISYRQAGEIIDRINVDVIGVQRLQLYQNSRNL